MNTKKLSIYIAATLIAIVLVYGIFTIPSEKLDNNSQVIDSTNETDTASKLSGEVKIGLILPLTGDLATHGLENLEGSKFGVSEFNKYLQEIDAPWHLTMVSEDSATNPVIALEKLTSLNAKGIDIVIGPETSSNIRNMKGYSDSNNMLLISCCSSAPALAIPNDSVFRLVPDDSNQGPAIAKLMQHEGIEVLIPVWRGDTWGDGLGDAAINSFMERGGIVGEKIRYNPESPEFSASTSLLAQQVQEYVDEYGADKVGVMFLGFGEILQFIQSASQHDTLDDVRWFGPGANTKEHRLIDDPIGLEFTTNVQFTTVQFTSSDNPIYQKVQNYMTETIGFVPNSFVHTSYDAVWLVGLAMLETQSTDVSVIKDIIPEIAENYSGAIGSIELNEAGDLAYADYEVWGIRDGQWVSLGMYTQSDDSIILYDKSDNVMSTHQSTKLSGEIKIGLILPLTGDLSSKGNENWEGSKFGISEFNKYLQEIDAPWHLKMVSEDSATNPVVALEKLSSLKAKGIDLVMGPETSSNIKNLKGYSDSNNMLLFSCCSTAPSLSIPNDSIYRLVPNDTFQGVALAKAIKHDGIDVLIPLWRGDTWGDGLKAATAKSFTERGGTVAEGIRYNPESPEFSASTSLLSSEVQKYIDIHGADKVAVAMIGFGETTHIMQSASQHEILNDVRWYGGDSNVKEIQLVEDPIASKFANDVLFTTTQFALSENGIKEKVDAHVLQTLGREGYSYINSSYDVVWIIGLSILAADSIDVNLVKENIHEVAANYEGAIGSTVLNEAGDLIAANYELWGIRDGNWASVGIYDHKSDSIILD